MSDDRLRQTSWERMTTLRSRLRLAASVCVLILFAVVVLVWLEDVCPPGSGPRAVASEAASTGKLYYLKCRHSYYRIHEGMTLAEVQAILGPSDPDLFQGIDG